MRRILSIVSILALLFVQGWEANARPATRPPAHKGGKTNNQKEVKAVVHKKNTHAVRTLRPDSKPAAAVNASRTNTPVLPESNTDCTPAKTVTIVNVSDRKSAPSAWSVNNDLLLARTCKPNPVAVKKEVKKEEPSFAETVIDWVQDKYASMIDVLPNQISNVMLYRFIDDWYGVKYRLGGTSKKGVDCSAFVQTLYKYVFGMDLLRTACMQFNSSQLIKDPSELKEGDLVFFRVNSSRISHVGVYLRNNFFVHSATSQGVSIASLTSAYWSKYFAGGGRILNN
ncbi:MAG TPA: NlpC/P60 family protein [Chitinophagaceae bacterium]|nr:NlpC/P60 family protein [Chitinophagaceae bacterium]HNF72576.1 NlpC/P60 family protein [Chitinophagaceae bacterium]